MFRCLIILMLLCSVVLSAQESEPITNPDTLPSFPGGPQSMMSYIQKRLKIPDEMKSQTSSNGCKSIVEFIITELGEIKNVFIVRSCINCNSCDNEAVKVIEGMPRWKPGIKDGKAVSVKMGFPIFFTLK